MTPRIALLDILRGVAIIGVVFYHFVFDLRLLEFIELDATRDPGWVAFAHILSGTFLFLVGVNLVLAHAKGLRWRAFWKRIGILVLASAAISVVTFFAYADRFVYFGILHAITLFSVLALPFLIAPSWLVAAAAVVVTALPYVVSSPFFDARITSWIGLWEYPPLTGDLVPVFPSFGWTLGGIVAGRLILTTVLGDRLAAFPSEGRAMRWLALLGRWSLVIYLVHQPVLVGAMYPVAQIVHGQSDQRSAEFYGSCFSSCIDMRGNAPQCRSYCQCALDKVAADDLWDALDTEMSTPEQREAVGEVTAQCRVETEEGS